MDCIKVRHSVRDTAAFCQIEILRGLPSLEKVFTRKSFLCDFVKNSFSETLDSRPNEISCLVNHRMIHRCVLCPQLSTIQYSNFLLVQSQLFVNPAPYLLPQQICQTNFVYGSFAHTIANFMNQRGASCGRGKFCKMCQVFA